MKKFNLVSLFLLIFMSVTLSAQTTAEIEAAKSVARSYGYSESEISDIINRQTGNTNYTGNNDKNSNLNQNIYGTVSEINRNEVVEQPVVVNVIDKPAGLKSGIFGHDIFTYSNLTFIPSYNIPTPENYIIAPGDELIIDIWGNASNNITRIVSPEGSIIIPDLGPVYLTGKTVKNAESILKSRLSKIYSGLSGKSPDTKMKLSVGKIRSISVNVMGDVTVPGTYVLPSLSTICSALYMAKGVTNLGTVRDIRLYRNNELLTTFDVYDFILNGDFGTNIRLQDNDVITVSSYKNIINIYGGVKRPMEYETVDGETLADIIKYAGGFKEVANSDLIHIDRNSGTEKHSFDVKTEDFSKFILQDGDVVSIKLNRDFFDNRVSISGSVWYPGYYSISEDMGTLSQLINAAGGLFEGTHMERGYIDRLDENLRPVTIGFSLQNIISGVENINLMRGDNVKIFSLEELRDKSTISVSGEVNSPGTFNFREGVTLGDVILMAGGFTEGATKNNIEIARRNKDMISNIVSDETAKLVKINLNEQPDKIDFALDPYDLVFIRKAPNYKVQQTVTINGEVAFPGTYVIEKNTIRLSDVVNKAYGVTVDAYVKGAKLTRVLTLEEYERLKIALKTAQEKVKNSNDTTVIDISMVGDRFTIGIDLVSALNYPGSYSDVVLRTGDIIDVPKMNNTVKISGGVLYPNTVAYNPKYNWRDYINLAGGFVKGARRSKTYAVYMNGMVSVVGKDNFRIEPGMELIIPQRTNQERQPISIAEIATAASMTTSMASLITLLIKLL